jgi:hypothetical protein
LQRTTGLKDFFQPYRPECFLFVSLREADSQNPQNQFQNPQNLRWRAVMACQCGIYCLTLHTFVTTRRLFSRAIMGLIENELKTQLMAFIL